MNCNNYKILFVFLIITTFSCKAQTPVIDFTDYDNRSSNETPNRYIKDTQNLLNPFVGTYVYNENGKMLKIVLQKKEMSYRYNHYEDLIIGEYQYIENGIEKSNTLNKLNINYTDGIYHSIHGNIIMDGDNLCDDCQPNEKHLRGGLVETTTDNLAEIDFKLTSVNGQPAIRVWISWRYRTAYEGQPLPQLASFPGGEYIMIKQ